MTEILSSIACCLCGRKIQPNAAAMCMDCLKIEVDLSNLIAQNVDLIECGKCGRWCLRNNQWVYHDLESASLLAFCLKKIHGLDRSDIRIRDASWVWTEPHSKRLKIALDIESGVLDEKVRVAQKILVEFKIGNKQCIECIRENTDHTWGACVQLRQRVGHKMSFFHLETCLIKAGLHNSMLDVKVTKEGVDMFFKSKTLAQRVVGFINTLFPTTSKTSKKLIGKDNRSNIHRNEYVVSMEVVPLCRYDLVCTPRESGRPPELMLVAQLSTNVHMLNPRNLNKTEYNAPKFFAKPFKPLLSAKNLIKFVVLDITSIDVASASSDESNMRIKDKGGLLAEATVAREDDFGMNDTIFRTTTHLGHLLKAGDCVLGYDLSNLVMDIANERRFNELSPEPLEIILVKKSFEKTREKKKKPRKQRRPRKGQGDAPQEELPTGHSSNSTGAVGDRKTDIEMPADEDTNRIGAEVPQWRMISDSILFDDDTDEAALHRELMEVDDNDDDETMGAFGADSVLPPEFDTTNLSESESLDGAAEEEESL